MVTALVAGPGAREFASTLRKAGVEAWCFDPAHPDPRPLLVVITGDREPGGDASGPASLSACADLVPDAPFTEWRSLMFSLWTEHSRSPTRKDVTMRNALIAAAKGSVALALLVPLGGAAAAVPPATAVPRDCSKDNNPAALVCRGSQEAQGRLNQLMKGTHPGK